MHARKSVYNETDSRFVSRSITCFFLLMKVDDAINLLKISIIWILHLVKYVGLLALCWLYICPQMVYSVQVILTEG